MRAVIKKSVEKLGLVIAQVPEPVIKPNEVLIQVHSCGLCGTDLSLYHGNAALIERFRPRFPLIVGHEFAGQVVKCGTAVTRVKLNEWVTVNPHLYCGTCSACTRGEEEICIRRPILAWDRPGGAAEFVAVRQENVYVLEEHVARSVGALGEPLAVAIHAVERLRVDGSERVCIVGAGPIAFLIAVACQEKGVASITVFGRPQDARRLDLIAGLGVSTVISGGDERELDLVDVVFDAGGTAASFAFAIQQTRPGGKVGALGIPPSAVELDLPELVLSEKTVVGARGYSDKSWRQTVAVLGRRREELQLLITHRVGLESVDEAMALLESGVGGKVFLEPGLRNPV
jgi:threonine dehydrogenase-like Zn-dependent dehydrogenase